MPAYGTFSTPVAIYQGDSAKVWTNESPAANAMSERVALGINQNISVSLTGLGPFSVAVQGADVDAPAAYADLVDSTGAPITITAPFGWVEVKANFVRLRAAVAAPGAITAMISLSGGGG